MVIFGPGRFLGQISLCLAPAWDVPFQYKLLTTNGHFRRWAAPRPDFPMSVCIFQGVLDRNGINACLRVMNN